MSVIISRSFLQAVLKISPSLKTRKQRKKLATLTFSKLEPTNDRITTAYSFRLIGKYFNIIQKCIWKSYRYSFSLFVYLSVSSLTSCISFWTANSLSCSFWEKSESFSDCSCLFCSFNCTFWLLCSSMKVIIAWLLAAKSINLLSIISALFLSLSSSFWQLVTFSSSSVLIFCSAWHRRTSSSALCFSMQIKFDCSSIRDCSIPVSDLSSGRLRSFSSNVWILSTYWGKKGKKTHL